MKRKSYYDVDAFRLLHLMRARPDHSSLPTRSLVVIDGEADWQDRPTPPPAPIESDLYDSNIGLDTFFRTRSNHEVYWRMWPKIPKKIFNRCVNRGWVAERDGAFHLTEKGLAHWNWIKEAKRPLWSFRHGRSHAVLSRYRERKRRVPYQWKRDETPLPLPTFGRRKGWGARLRQHEVDRKQPPSWEE